MSKLFSMKYLLVAVAVVWLIVGLISPQIRLCARVVCGNFNPPVQVIAFSPTLPAEELVSVRLGALRLRLPKAALGEKAAPSVESVGITLQWDGTGFLAWPPISNGVPLLATECDVAQDFPPSTDEISLRAAAYAANTHDASPWMSAGDARSLSDLLCLRKLLPGGIERVEILRNPGIKGMLLFRQVDEHRMAMVFDYFSPDESLSGTSIITLDDRSAPALATARAILGSFSFSDAAVTDSACELKLAENDNDAW